MSSAPEPSSIDRIGGALINRASLSPLTDTALVLPGGHQAPTDPATRQRFPSATAVRAWEADHADLRFGGEGDLSSAGRPVRIGYMYNQKLDFTPTALEYAVRRASEGAGVNDEDLFWHYAEDTVMFAPDPTSGAAGPFGRRPWVSGYTNSADHAGFVFWQAPPWNVDAWRSTADGGALFVALDQRFDAVDLVLATPAAAGHGGLEVDYPCEVNAVGKLVRWCVLTPTDETSGLMRSGRITWTPPPDWTRANLHDGSGRSYGGGAFFGQTALRDGAVTWWIRIRYIGGGVSPRLDDVQLRGWHPALNPSDGGRLRLVPGWHPDNDTDGDGYVSDAEWTSRPHPECSARFRYESRVVPLGSMWGPRSSDCAVNVFHPRLGGFLGDFYRATWTADGDDGAYNDDALKFLPGLIDVRSGGTIAELGTTARHPDALGRYVSAFASVLRTIRQRSGAGWIAANISAENLFLQSDWNPLLDGLDALLREDYLRPSVGIAGYFGLAKSWDTAALSAMGRLSVVSVRTLGGRASRLGASRESWERDLQSGLAQYLLVSHRGLTAYHAWNSSYHYGSGLTESWTFHTPGIPMTMAYLPEALLQTDLGNPTAALPDGCVPLLYRMRTRTPANDYTVIGDTTSAELVHPELVSSGRVPVLPTYTCHLWSSSRTVVPQGPADTVLARRFQKGLVLYRTHFFGQQPGFDRTLSPPIPLPGRFRRVRFDGTRGPVITQLVLAGYEGAILEDAESTAGGAP